MSKQYLALARVSSREQEREGFSLEVQEEALYRYASQNDGEIVKLFRIAELLTDTAISAVRAEASSRPIPKSARKVRRIFDLYGFEGHTLDSRIDELDREGLVYSLKTRRFTRSKLHLLLRDRSYLGEIPYKGQWSPGKQETIIDRATFDRVRRLLGGQIYRAHELTMPAT